MIASFLWLESIYEPKTLLVTVDTGDDKVLNHA